MRRLIALIAIFASSATAQTTPWPPEPLANLKEYLQLSDVQLQIILHNNDKYNRWSAERQSRIRQIQEEIVQETAKSPLDPTALGVLYAEIETLCRELRDRAILYRSRNLEAFEPAQKARLKALEAALKLLPLASEAQFSNLAGELTSAPYGFTSRYVSTGGARLGGPIVAPGCSLPMSGVATRTGDFTATPDNR